MSSIRYPSIFSPASRAIFIIFARGPTKIGSINFSSAASIAPTSADFSHGYATAVTTGSSLAHRLNRFS
jgi:hypothetical protein